MGEQKRRPGGDPRRRSDERGVTSAIYGLVVCSSTLAAAAVSGRLSFVAVSVLVTVAVYWLAESYAHALARHAVKQMPLGWSDIRAIVSQGWPMVSASFIPLGHAAAHGCFGYFCFRRCQYLTGRCDRAVGVGWLDRLASQRVARLALTHIRRGQCDLRVELGRPQERAAHLTSPGEQLLQGAATAVEVVDGAPCQGALSVYERAAVIEPGSQVGRVIERHRLVGFRNGVGALGNPWRPGRPTLLSRVACSPSLAHVGRWPIIVWAVCR